MKKFITYSFFIITSLSLIIVTKPFTVLAGPICESLGGVCIISTSCAGEYFNLPYCEPGQTTDCQDCTRNPRGPSEVCCIPFCPNGQTCVNVYGGSVECERNGGTPTRCSMQEGGVGNCCAQVESSPDCIGETTDLEGQCVIMGVGCDGRLDGDGGCGNFRVCCVPCGQPDLPCCLEGDPCNRGSVCNTQTNTCQGGVIPNLPIFCDPNDFNSRSCTGSTNSNLGGICTAIGCIPITTSSSAIGFLLPWLIGIAGGIAFILMVYAGFIIMTSSGDPRRLQAGKELLTAAIMGLLLLILGAYLLRIIGYNILGIFGV